MTDQEARDAASATYVDDEYDIVIDLNAEVEHIDPHRAWVQAWLWVRLPEETP